MPFSDMPAATQETLRNAQAAYIRKDYVEALRLDQPLAAEGNYLAQFMLGSLYVSGYGVPIDDVRAFSWLRKSANQGYAPAEWAVGLMYSDGKGVPQNDVEAAAWLRKAADQGYADAQVQLGVKYLDGAGVPKDSAQAASWFRKAADLGAAKGQALLGFRYYNGDGVQKDYEQALAWFRKAANQGNPLGERGMGVMYYYGYGGVPHDSVQAASFFHQAADQGEDIAQVLLGDMYAEGVGVEQNDEEALRWWRKAAAQGNATAKQSLADAEKAMHENTVANAPPALRFKCYLHTFDPGGAKNVSDASMNTFSSPRYRKCIEDNLKQLGMLPGAPSPKVETQQEFIDRTPPALRVKCYENIIHSGAAKGQSGEVYDRLFRACVEKYRSRAEFQNR